MSEPTLTCSVDYEKIRNIIAEEIVKNGVRCTNNEKTIAKHSITLYGASGDGRGGLVKTETQIRLIWIFLLGILGQITGCFNSIFKLFM